MISIGTASSSRPPISFRGNIGTVSPPGSTGGSSSTDSSSDQDATGNQKNSESSGIGSQNRSEGSGSLPESQRPPGARPPVIPNQQNSESSSAISGETDNNSSNVGESDSSNAPGQLSPEERRQVQKLRRIDAKVRAHEQAHLAAAGQHAQGGIQFEYKRGPDGKRYAVGGEVNLDTSKAETPEKTIRKMRQVRKAALAPANPSPQDQKVASSASQKLNEARQEKNQEGEEGQSNSNSSQSQGPEQNNGSQDNDNSIFPGSENNFSLIDDTNENDNATDGPGGIEQFQDFGRDNSSNTNGNRLNPNKETETQFAAFQDISQNRGTRSPSSSINDASFIGSNGNGSSSGNSKGSELNLLV